MKIPLAILENTGGMDAQDGESALLGRSNVATTFNLYVRSNLNQEKKCVERMSKFLGMAEL